MANNSSVELRSEISLSLERVCEGVALHFFHTTAQRLNEAAKSYAAQTWGAEGWVTRSLLVISKPRRRRLLPHGRDSTAQTAVQAVIDVLWDAHDILVMLQRCSR